MKTAVVSPQSFEDPEASTRGAVQRYSVGFRATTQASFAYLRQVGVGYYIQRAKATFHRRLELILSPEMSNLYAVEHELSSYLKHGPEQLCLKHVVLIGL